MTPEKVQDAVRDFVVEAIKGYVAEPFILWGNQHAPRPGIATPYTMLFFVTTPDVGPDGVVQLDETTAQRIGIREGMIETRIFGLNAMDAAYRIKAASYLSEIRYIMESQGVELVKEDDPQELTYRESGRNRTAWGQTLYIRWTDKELIDRDVIESVDVNYSQNGNGAPVNYTQTIEE